MCGPPFIKYNSVQGGKLGYRGEGLVEINAFDLSETLCD